jgi:hypothetical protein
MRSSSMSGRGSSGLDLSLQLDSMTNVAPPPELALSPEIGKISKCSKVLALEPYPTELMTTLSHSLDLLVHSLWLAFRWFLSTLV